MPSDSIRWFVTSTAIREYMLICGENPDDRRAFHAAAERLRLLCRIAKFKREYAGGKYESWQVRCRVGGRSTRLNLSVSLSPSAEGYADQLVSVQDNDQRANR